MQGSPQNRPTWDLPVVSLDHIREHMHHNAWTLPEVFAVMDTSGTGRIYLTQFVTGLNTYMYPKLHVTQAKDLFNYINTIDGAEATPYLSWEKLRKSLEETQFHGPWPKVVETADDGMAIGTVHTWHAVERAKYNRAESLEHERDMRDLDSVVMVLNSAIRHQRTLFGREVYDIPSLFAAMDRKQDGVLSSYEFTACLHRIGVGMSKLEAERVTAAVSQHWGDESGYVTEASLTKAMSTTHHHKKVVAKHDFTTADHDPEGLEEGQGQGQGGGRGGGGGGLRNKIGLRRTDRRQSLARLRTAAYGDDTAEDKVAIGKVHTWHAVERAKGHRGSMLRHEREMRDLDSVIICLKSAIRHKRQLYGQTIRDIPSLFFAMDRGGNMHLTGRDFQAALHRLGLGMSRGEATRVAACFVKHHAGHADDGSISLKSFANAMKSTHHHDRIIAKHDRTTASHRVKKPTKAAMSTSRSMRAVSQPSPEDVMSPEAREARGVLMHRTLKELKRQLRKRGVSAAQLVSAMSSIEGQGTRNFNALHKRGGMGEDVITYDAFERGLMMMGVRLDKNDEMKLVFDHLDKKKEGVLHWRQLHRVFESRERVGTQESHTEKLRPTPTHPRRRGRPEARTPAQSAPIFSSNEVADHDHDQERDSEYRYRRSVLSTVMDGDEEEDEEEDDDGQFGFYSTRKRKDSSDRLFAAAVDQQAPVQDVPHRRSTPPSSPGRAGFRSLGNALSSRRGSGSKNTTAHTEQKLTFPSTPVTPRMKRNAEVGSHIDELLAGKAATMTKEDGDDESRILTSAIPTLRRETSQNLIALRVVSGTRGDMRRTIAVEPGTGEKMEASSTKKVSASLRRHVARGKMKIRAKSINGLLGVGRNKLPSPVAMAEARGAGIIRQRKALEKARRQAAERRSSRVRRQSLATTFGDGFKKKHNKRRSLLGSTLAKAHNTPRLEQTPTPEDMVETLKRVRRSSGTATKKKKKKSRESFTQFKRNMGRLGEQEQGQAASAPAAKAGRAENNKAQIVSAAVQRAMYKSGKPIIGVVQHLDIIYTYMDRDNSSMPSGFIPTSLAAAAVSSMTGQPENAMMKFFEREHPGMVNGDEVVGAMVRAFLQSGDPDPDADDADVRPSSARGVHSARRPAPPPPRR